MTPQARAEVREMLTDILGGYQEAQKLRDEAAAKREVLINISLNNIDGHLVKLNGKVAEHEKVINVHLPHTIQHCPQTEAIEELKKTQISAKAVYTAMIVGIGATGTLFSIGFVLYKVFIAP